MQSDRKDEVKLEPSVEGWIKRVLTGAADATPEELKKIPLFEIKKEGEIVNPFTNDKAPAPAVQIEAIAKNLKLAVLAAAANKRDDSLELFNINLALLQPNEAFAGVGSKFSNHPGFNIAMKNYVVKYIDSEFKSMLDQFISDPAKKSNYLKDWESSKKAMVERINSEAPEVRERFKFKTEAGVNPLLQAAQDVAKASHMVLDQKDIEGVPYLILSVESKESKKEAKQAEFKRLETKPAQINLLVPNLGGFAETALATQNLYEQGIPKYISMLAELNRLWSGKSFNYTLNQTTPDYFEAKYAFPEILLDATEIHLLSNPIREDQHFISNVQGHMEALTTLGGKIGEGFYRIAKNISPNIKLDEVTPAVKTLLLDKTFYDLFKNNLLEIRDFSKLERKDAESLLKNKETISIYVRDKILNSKSVSSLDKILKGRDLSKLNKGDLQTEALISELETHYPKLMHSLKPTDIDYLGKVESKEREAILTVLAFLRLANQDAARQQSAPFPESQKATDLSLMQVDTIYGILPELLEHAKKQKTPILIRERQLIPIKEDKKTKDKNKPVKDAKEKAQPKFKEVINFYIYGNATGSGEDWGFTEIKQQMGEFSMLPFSSGEIKSSAPVFTQSLREKVAQGHKQGSSTFDVRNSYPHLLELAQHGLLTKDIIQKLDAKNQLYMTGIYLKDLVDRSPFIKHLYLNEILSLEDLNKIPKAVVPAESKSSLSGEFSERIDPEEMKPAISQFLKLAQNKLLDESDLPLFLTNEDVRKAFKNIDAIQARGATLFGDKKQEAFNISAKDPNSTAIRNFCLNSLNRKIDSLLEKGEEDPESIFDQIKSVGNEAKIAGIQDFVESKRLLIPLMNSLVQTLPDPTLKEDVELDVDWMQSEKAQKNKKADDWGGDNEDWGGDAESNEFNDEFSDSAKNKDSWDEAKPVKPALNFEYRFINPDSLVSFVDLVEAKKGHTLADLKNAVENIFKPSDQKSAPAPKVAQVSTLEKIDACMQKLKNPAFCKKLKEAVSDAKKVKGAKDDKFIYKLEQFSDALSGWKPETSQEASISLAR